MTERTDISKSSPGGWLFYDGTCGRCTAWAERLTPWLVRRGYRVAPLAGNRARRLVGPSAATSDEMLLHTAAGRVIGGADAALHLAGLVRWLQPLAAAAVWPPVAEALRAIYGWFARRRHCSSGACSVDAGRAAGWTLLPFAALLAAAVMTGAAVAGWLHMMLLCTAMYAGLKWWTWRTAGRRCPTWRHAGYLLAWPGMDAERFLNRGVVPSRPRGAQWLAAIGRVALGAGLVGLAGLLRDASAVAAGWSAAVGFLLSLHMGAFDLLSLAWRRAGVDARPLCDRPLASRTLAEFWGQRWNRAYVTLSRRLLFQPLRGRIGVRPAMAAAFVASGLVHELAISLPARGGWGGPTIYFSIQALVALLQNRVRRLGRGILGRIVTLAAVLGPAWLLFHPPFMHRVMLPLLAAMGIE